MLFPAEGASGAGSAQPQDAGNQGAAAGASGQPAATGAAASGGAPARDWAKDYGELEGKYKRYESFGTPEQIDNAIKWAHWAQDVKKRHDAGEFVSRAEYEKLQRGAPAASAEPADPYSDWESLTPQQQAQVYRQDVLKGVNEALDGFRKELTGMTQNFQGQHNLALKLVPLLSKHPEIDPTTLLAKMFERVTITPDRAAELEIESMLAPSIREKEIKDAVEKAVAEAKAIWQQEQESKDAAQFNTRPGPRLVPSDKQTREQRLKDHEGEFNKLFNAVTRAA